MRRKPSRCGETKKEPWGKRNELRPFKSHFEKPKETKFGRGGRRRAGLGQGRGYRKNSQQGGGCQL